MEFNSHFYCVLTLSLMRDPVMDNEGNTYERAAIEEWIHKEGTSPITRNPLAITDLRTNRVLKCAIAEEVAKAKELSESLRPPPAPPTVADIEAALAGFVLDDGAATTVDGLQRVTSYEGYTLSNTAVFLFTGRRGRLVTFCKAGGARSIPHGPILWSDGTPLNAAHRVLAYELGAPVNLRNIRRFVWNRNTAIYAATTGDVLNTRRRRGSATRMELIAVDQITAVSAEEVPENLRFSDSSRCMIVATLNALAEIASKTAWQCCVDGGRWVPYDPQVQRAIAEAEQQGRETVRVLVRAVPYELNLRNTIQTRVDGFFDTVRPIRKVTTQNYCS